MSVVKNKPKFRFLLTLALVLLLSLASAAIASADSTNWVAHLKGGNEVPARDTLAQGQAIFKLSEDGAALHYKLIVANINNVVASHIHLGTADVNGPVVVFLYGPAAPDGGRLDGVIAQGTITEANFVGPLAGQPFSALLEAIMAGNTYVNVHTNDGVAPTNTGPGDFPGGEVRGQIH
ncbi:MAG TPA: CHRD domain-containing protein [Anaerolineales bacterium]|nr:CHRD domain-containing protein [Anaerolineales bacterium]